MSQPGSDSQWSQLSGRPPVAREANIVATIRTTLCRGPGIVNTEQHCTHLHIAEKMAMPRWVAKLLTLIATFFLPLICTLLPYKLSDSISRKGALGKRILGYLMCFGGGVFFGTYLLHMGPEVHMILKASLLDPRRITYPLAELITGVGFLVVLFSEKLVLKWNKGRIRQKREESHGKKNEDGKAEPKHSNGDGRASACAKCNSPMLSQPVFDAEDSSTCTKTVTNQDFDLPDSSTSGTGECDTDSFPGTHEQLSQLEKVEDKLANGVDMEVGSVEMSGGHHHHATRSLILILALSLHRIFEGMTIGLQPSVTSVARLFGAVMCHEMVIGFSLGLQFVRSGFALRRLLITSFVCSVIMPVGVLIGLVMTEAGSRGSGVDIANGILQAIAMGTFIYVTFFEILQEEVDPRDTSLGKIASIAAGFALMALLNLVPEGDMVGMGRPIGYVNGTVTD